MSILPFALAFANEMTHSIHCEVEGMQNENYLSNREVYRFKYRDSPSEFCSSKTESTIETGGGARFSGDGTVGVRFGGQRTWGSINGITSYNDAQYHSN